MSAESLKQLKNLNRRFAYAAKKGNIERMEELEEEEDALIRTLTPTERYDYMLKEAVKMFGGNAVEIDADLEERANSTDPGIKAGYLDGFLTALMEVSNDILSEHVVSLDKLNRRIDDAIQKVKEGGASATTATAAECPAAP